MRSPESSPSRLRKRTRSSGSSPAVGSSTISTRGSFSSACAMPTRWRMPPENPPSARWRASVRLTSSKQLVDAVTRGARLEPLGGGDVVEELERRELRVDAEILRQVAERLAQRVGLLRQVDAVPQHAARARPRDGGEDAHERGLAGAVRAQEPGDPGRECERELRQRPAATGITLAERFDGELHEVPPRTGVAGRLARRDGQSTAARRARLRMARKYYSSTSAGGDNSHSRSERDSERAKLSSPSRSLARALLRCCSSQMCSSTVPSVSSR